MPKKGSVGAYKKALRQDLMGDLGFTQSQLDAIAGNLLTTGRGLARSLTADQARQVAAIQRISVRGAKKVAGIVEKTAETATNRYGSAMSGIVDTSLLAAVGTAKAAKSIGAGAVRSAKGLAQAGSTALAIQQASAQEAYEGANYAMAVALKARGQADATAVAEMQFQLKQTRLQADLDLRNQKELMQYAQKLEEKKLGGLKGATDMASELASLMPSFRIWSQDPGKTGTTAEWIATNVPATMQPLFLELVPRLTSRGILDGNLGYAATVDAIVDSMVMYNSDLLKMRPELEEVVLASLKTSWNAMTMGTLNVGGDGGGFNQEPTLWGAGAGALAGGALGSVIPGAGTAVGAAFGTIAGGILGNIIGDMLHQGSMTQQILDEAKRRGATKEQLDEIKKQLESG